jgi:DNA-binding CsgD family transcriptional regulator
LDNNSKVDINVDLNAAPLYQAEVNGALHADQYLDFYKNLFYFLPSPSASPSAQAFNKERVDNLIKTTIAKNNNPFYTILVLSSIDLRRYYLEDPTYYGKLIDGLGDVPGNIYARGLEDRKRTFDFEMSSVNEFLNVRFFALLLITILLLSVALGYTVIKTRRGQRASNLHINEALASLTKKEKEIIELMKEGKTNKEIATALFIEISTVKTHVNSIFQKFKVSNRGELLICLQNQKLQPGVEP